MNLSLFSAKIVSRLVCNALGLELWRERILYLAEFCDLLQDFWDLRFAMLWFVLQYVSLFGRIYCKKVGMGFDKVANCLFLEKVVVLKRTVGVCK